MVHFLILVIIGALATNSSAAPINSNVQNSPLASALIIGTEANGRTLFLCRTFFLGTNQFGATWAGAQQCIFTDNGKVHAVSEFTIPNEKEFGHHMWSIKGEKGLPIGKDNKGNSLFLCQTQINGSLLPGKTWSGYNHCNIAYHGVEVIADLTYILSAM